MLLGFGELEFDSHIGCFYCHKNYQNSESGRRICQAIERKGLEFGLERLFVESSLTAKPFFEQMGFLGIREQQVSFQGETFINYAMEKPLHCDRPYSP